MMHECWDSGRPCVLWSVTRASAGCRISWNFFAKKHIDGHAPGITGKAVQAYRLAGVENDHECANSEEVLDKLRAGFHIYIREGSGAKNLETLIRTLLDANVALDQCAFCTDE